MFNSHILEVIIGLVLILFLFSLLVTAIQEGLARWVNARAVVLEEAILTMLGKDDEWLEAFKKHPRYQRLLPYKGYQGGTWVHRLFNKFFVRQKRPSYLAPEVFAKIYIATLDDYFFNKEIPQSHSDNSNENNDVTKESLSGPFLLILLLKWILRVFYQCILHIYEWTLLFFRPGLLDMLNCSLEIISKNRNRIKYLEYRIEVLLSGGKTDYKENHESLRLKEVLQLNRELRLEDLPDRIGKKDSLAILNDFLRNSQGSEALFKKQVEDWFTDTMMRVSGWYKRRAQVSLMLIGFLVAMIFNINPIHIAKHLNESDEAREVLVAASEGIAVKDSAYELDNYLRLLGEAVKSDTTIQAVDSIFLDETLAKIDTAQTMDSVQKRAFVEKFMNNLMAELRLVQFPSDSMKQDSLDSFLGNVIDIAANIHSLREYSAIMGIGWNEETLGEPLKKDFWERVEQIIKELFWNSLSYFLFAIGMSLGAAFWFDLLKRFVRIRHTGEKPVDKDGDGDSGMKIYG